MRWIAIGAVVWCVASACSSSTTGGAATFCAAVTAACHSSSSQTCDDLLKADALNFPSCTAARSPFLDCLASKQLACPSSQTIFAGAGDSSGIPFQLGSYTAYTDSTCADLGDKWYACENPVKLTCLKNALGCTCSTSAQTPGPSDTVVSSCDAASWQCCHDATGAGGRYSSRCDCAAYQCLQEVSGDDCVCKLTESPLSTGDKGVSTCTSSLTSISVQAETLCCDLSKNGVGSTICGCTSHYADCASWIGGNKVTTCATKTTRACDSGDVGPTSSCAGLRWR